MTMRMLIDARHQEETRVAVIKGNRIEEFDFESAEHKQLKGNIYLAKVTRVEPSLQAAFVDYGGNRHGFLAFSEIHPDYYQIPKEDREALLREEAEHAAEEERLRAAEYDGDDDGRRTSSRSTTSRCRPRRSTAERRGAGEGEARTRAAPRAARGGRERVRGERRRDAAPQAPESAPPLQDPGRDPPPPGAARPGRQGGARQQGRGAHHLSHPRRPLLRADAQYRHGGGISRKISNGADRKRLKQIMADLNLPLDAWAASSAPPACRAPRSRSSATSTISPGSGTRSARRR